MLFPQGKLGIILGSLLQDQARIAKLKSAYLLTHLLLLLDVWDVKPTNWKSYAWSLLMSSNLLLLFLEFWDVQLT